MHHGDHDRWSDTVTAEISHADYHQRIRDTVHDPSSYECPLCGRRLADKGAVDNSTERSSAQPHRPPARRDRTRRDRFPLQSGDAPPMTAPVLVLDVDGVLNPFGPEPARSGFARHRYNGLNTAGEKVEFDVHLHPQHGAWIEALVALGVDAVWGTTWGDIANEWIAPRIGLTTDLPVLDVGAHVSTRFGWTSKATAVLDHIGRDRPLAWLDDIFGGKEFGWAEGRSDRGVPTVVEQIDGSAGLAPATQTRVERWAEQVTGRN